mgnify:CR=1 FL=1
MPVRARTVGEGTATQPPPLPVGAPPGRVLPVVEVVPVRRQSQPAPAPAPSAGPVLGVPVRVQPEPRQDDLSAAPRPPTVVPTEEGDFWQGTVRALVEAEAINALVRELALQSQLIARDTDHWMLRVERESLNQPASRDRLQAALAAAGHAVTLGVEIGVVTDSPAKRSAVAAAERQRLAEEIIWNDPFVQSMMRDFGAKIVPGSIKPQPRS